MTGRIPIAERTLAIGYRQARRRPPQGTHHAEHPGIGLPVCRLAGSIDPALRAGRWRPRRPGLGPDHPDTLATQIRLANAYRDAGRYDEAIPILERTIATLTAKLGPDHLRTLVTRSILADTYRCVGQLDRAISLLERIVAAAQTAKLGPDHPETLNTQNYLANAYGDARRYDRAIALLERTLAARTAKLGADHPAPSRPDSIWRRPTRRGAIRCQGRVAASRRTRRAEEDAGASPPRRRPDHRLPWLETSWRRGNGTRPNRFSGRPWQSGTRDAPTTGIGSIPRACSDSSLLGQRKYAEAEPLLISGYEGLKAREARLPACEASSA